LLGSEPEGALRACRQETRAVGAGPGIFFPADRVTVFVGSAAAIFTVFGADAVTVLGDLACDPVLLWKCADYIANQLGLANAAGVATDDDDAPILFLRCRW
jgi:hypothetical protein